MFLPEPRSPKNNRKTTASPGGLYLSLNRNETSPLYTSRQREPNETANNTVRAPFEARVPKYRLMNTQTTGLYLLMRV